MLCRLKPALLAYARGMASEDLRRAWAELVAPEDYEAHMAAIGQAEANAHLIKKLIDDFPMRPLDRILFAGAGTGQMFDYVTPKFLLANEVIFTDIRGEFLECLKRRLAGVEHLRYQAVVDDIEEPQIGPIDAAAIVLVLEHVDWRRALDALVALGARRLFIVIQINPPAQSEMVSPNRTLPGTLATLPPGAKSQLLDPRHLKAFLKPRHFRKQVDVPVPVADGKTMLGLVFDKQYPTYESSLSERDRQLDSELRHLNPRGQAVTERKLRAIYAEASDHLRGEVARFLRAWRSKRGDQLADEWLAGPLAPGVVHWALSRFNFRDRNSTIDRDLALAARTDISDRDVDDLVDNFSSFLWPGEPRHEECVAFVARYLSHPSGEVRWTALFSLGKFPITSCRSEYERLTDDTTLTRYGYVSGLAKKVLHLMDTDDEVDLYDTREP
jgi:hypothetical protein